MGKGQGKDWPSLSICSEAALFASYIQCNLRTTESKEQQSDWQGFSGVRPAVVEIQGVRGRLGTCCCRPPCASVETQGRSGLVQSTFAQGRSLVHIRDGKNEKRPAFGKQRGICLSVHPTLPSIQEGKEMASSWLTLVINSPSLPN